MAMMPQEETPSSSPAGNGKLVLMSQKDGHVLSSTDIPNRVDQIAYDPGTHRVYCASGTGKIAVVGVENGVLGDAGRSGLQRGLPQHRRRRLYAHGLDRLRQGGCELRPPVQLSEVKKADRDGVPSKAPGNPIPFQMQSINTESQSAASKVPEVTLVFWAIKILATTLGETGGDAVSMSMDLGYLVSTGIFAVIFILAVIVQVTAKKFHPFVYWITIIATTTVGTTLADFCGPLARHWVCGWNLDPVRLADAVSTHLVSHHGNCRGRDGAVPEVGDFLLGDDHGFPKTPGTATR